MLVQNRKTNAAIYPRDLNSLLLLVVDVRLPPCTYVHFVEKICGRITSRTTKFMRNNEIVLYKVSR